MIKYLGFLAWAFSTSPISMCLKYVLLILSKISWMFSVWNFLNLTVYLKYVSIFSILSSFFLYKYIFVIIYLFIFKMKFPSQLHFHKVPHHIAPHPYALSLWRRSSIPSPTPASPVQPPITRGIMPPSPPIDVGEGHPLLHVYLESCLISCIIYGCLFSPWEACVVQLLDVILYIGLQSHSVLTVLSPLFYWGSCV